MKRFYLFILLLITLIPFSSAEEINSLNIETKINSIITYAERYEAGIINYLQLIAHAHSIREEVNEMLGKDVFEIMVGNESRGFGLTEEAVRNIFGDPTYYEEWVWVENEERDMKLDKAVPRWEKSVFDGNKIHMSFNAWPHVLKENDELTFFYRIDFDIRFKKNFNIDIISIINDVKDDAENYYNTGNGEDQILEKIILHEKTLRGYLDENREDCISIMDNLFGSENKKKKENRVVWEINFYNEEDYNVLAEVHICDGCEWPWINVEFRAEGDIQFNEQFVNKDREYYRQLNIEELNSILEKDIDEINTISEDLKNNAEKFLELKSEINLVSQVLDEKYYSNTEVEERLKIFDERLNLLDSILSKYGNIQKSPFDETRYEVEIFKDIIERQDSWCMYIEDVKCDIEEGCYNGECIYALGGIEDCSNQVDDDNDNIIDCNDPDCAKECGRLCEDTCMGENACWDKTNELCKNICEDGCWDCKENCDNVCEECWSCTNSDELKDSCYSCWICQDNAYGHGCKEECDPCNECKKEKTEEECVEECKNCNECEENWNKENCEERCGDDELCLSACKGEITVCEEGLFDCNFDNVCESEEPCEINMEICNDKLDNNEDGFIDCEDIGNCENNICDNNKVCQNGACIESVIEVIEEELEETEQVEEGLEIREEELEEVISEECNRVEDCGENEICSNTECRALDVIIEEYEEETRESVEVEEEVIEEVEEEIQQEPKSEPEPVSEPESEPESTPEPAPTTGESILDLILGKVTGLVTQEGCETDEDCNNGQQCDKFRKECVCKYGFFDCNGNGEGNDADGCESTDPTCSGERELCPGGCNENQFCNLKVGWCECLKGYRDCDGDWMNGCETTEEECKGCETDEDCAKPRCSDYGNFIQKFGCMKGESWSEQKASFGIGGGCIIRPTGRTDSYVDFYAWGNNFERLDQRKRAQQMGMQKAWCEFELENIKKERIEIENSLNEEFYIWFFNQYVNQDLENFERHIGAIWDIYWRIVDINRRTSEMLNCLNIEEWPEEYKEINIKYEGDYGSVEIWEEKKEVDFEIGPKEFHGKREMFSPYMKAWIFPNKEFMKNLFREKMETGEFLGPPEEHRTTLNPSDLENIKQDEEAMKMINELIEKYGDAELLFVIKDNEEVLFKVLINVNKDILINAQVNKNPLEEPNVYFEASFDFIYKMIEKEEKEMQGSRIEMPPWEKRKGIGETIKDVKNNVDMGTTILFGIASGDIKIKPLSGLKYMQLIDYIFK